MLNRDAGALFEGEGGELAGDHQLRFKIGCFEQFVQKGLQETSRQRKLII